MSAPQIYNFEISQNNFNQIVLTNSYKLPVVAIFMSPSIGTCIQMEQRMGEFAESFAGEFILARIDIEMEPDLRNQYDITNVPSVKIFKDAEPVYHEVGLMEANEISAMLKQFGIFKASDDMREQARQLHLSGDTPAAIQTLTEAIKSDPSNVSIAMDMVQVMLDIHLLEQASELFNKLPDKAKESETGKALIGQITFKGLAAKTIGKTALLNQVSENENDFDARFDLAICFVADHQYPEAMDQLFSILDKALDYKNGAAQEMTVNIIQMLAPTDPQQAKEFRQILGNMLNN